MKSKFPLSLVTVFFLLVNCEIYGAEKKAKQPASPPSAQKKAESAQNDDLVGEWEMVGFIVDTNDNLQIDEAERAALKKPGYKDVMQLNRDGSGEFTVAKLPGRYEVTNTGTGGRRYLTWYDRSNGPHRVGSILKVTREELHIKEPDGYGMFVWKRL
jgi:hypothetical protein